VTARPFRLTAPVVPETDLHEAVAEALWRLLLPPAMWTTFPAGAVPLPPQFAAKLARMGLARGWPDILLVHQGIFGIELKRDGSGLSRSRTVTTRRGGLRVLEGQADVFPKLILAGFVDIAVCRSVEAVLSQLAEWRVPVRGRVAA
jgi:hypothetical protein